MKHSKLLYTVALALAPHFCLAQQLAFNDSALAVDSGTATPSSVSTAAVSTVSMKSADEKPLTDRWLDLETLSHSERYRDGFTTGGVRAFDNAQQRSLIGAKIKLDKAGRYEIGLRASSGRYFNWAFGSYTGEGFIPRVATPAATDVYLTGAEGLENLRAVFADPAGLNILTHSIKSNGWQFYMRELYLSATPVKPVTLEFGSFGIERGYSTEITTFDDDGYLSGERIRLHDAKHLFFDEVAFTNAYFGSVGTVNVFHRGSDLENFNYRQVTAKKKLNKHVAFSGEYTWQTGTDTLREAVVVQTPATEVIDSIRFEAYERLSSITFAGLAQSPIGPIPSITVKGASGFAVAFNKKLGRLSGDIGFATIDSDYSVYANSRFFHSVGFALNGDTYAQGNRPFMHASYEITPGVTAFGFFTHEVGATRVLAIDQQGLNAGVNFDLKAMVNKEKRVF